ncbi:MAG: hypothetical protein AB4057_01865 [Crocosphaera sp.]
MTIQELIDNLSQYDPNTPVVISGYEGGYNDVTIVEKKTMQLNVNNRHYYGAHDCVKGLIVPNKPMVDVICLAGFNPNCNEPSLSYH